MRRDLLAPATEWGQPTWWDDETENKASERGMINKSRSGLIESEENRNWDLRSVGNCLLEVRLRKMPDDSLGLRPVVTTGIVFGTVAEKRRPFRPWNLVCC